MKKFTIILTVLIAMTIKTNAQIPNGGFEAWTTQSGIEIPSDVWVTANLVEKPEGVTYNPVTKSTDHYPQDVGIYSIRMENNISMVNTNPDSPEPYWRIAYGATTTAPLTSHYMWNTGPSFPITGHPESFCGYYKFLPQNNDTLTIELILFQNGSPVAIALLNSTETVSEWTSFNLPISDYTTADSALIWLMASQTVPYGNSILYVDNLSFDALITSVSFTSSKLPIKFNLSQNYPNPFNAATNIEFDIPVSSEVAIIIYDNLGRMKDKILDQNLSAGRYRIKWNAADYASGIYFIRMISEKKMFSIKAILLK